MVDLSRHRQKTTKDQWRSNPMPDEFNKLVVDKTYHTGQWDRMRLGIKPEEMEDKWFIYEENYWIYFHRSWTGNCIYKVKFEMNDETLSISDAYANRNVEQYTINNNEYDSDFVVWLIDRFLLNKKDSSFPKQPSE
ncbi:MAG: hypothetical protein GY714_21765 [Desulfobacterales bacterium]|nr:hypothetical protein [Desulfobacterales bacterium]